MYFIFSFESVKACMDVSVYMGMCTTEFVSKKKEKRNLQLLFIHKMLNFFFFANKITFCLPHLGTSGFEPIRMVVSGEWVIRFTIYQFAVSQWDDNDKYRYSAPIHSPIDDYHFHSGHAPLNHSESTKIAMKQPSL